MLSARDTLLAQGKLGIVTSRAIADFDNLVITPNGYATIYSSAFNPGDGLGARTNTGPGAWSQGASGLYAQSSVAGDARAIIGAASGEDQSVSVHARAIAFAVATGQQEHWFGALLRYADDQNYAYVSLRSSNRISLRQLVNGRIETLAEAFLHRDTGHLVFAARRGAAACHERVRERRAAPRGQSGLLAYKAAAEYDDFLAYRP